MNAQFETNGNTCERPVYCMFCMTGHEEAFEPIFESQELKPIYGYVKRSIVKNGVSTTEKRALMPGYVFFEADELTSVQINALRECRFFIRILSYENGDCALHGSDLEFVHWLKSRGGVIDVSRVYRDGDRIRVIDGPLKDYEGCIVSVNKKRKCVAIKLSSGNLISKIWCSIEYIDKINAED